MPETGILGTFGSHAFLRGLRPQHLMRLASGVRPFTAAAGEYLAREGQPAESFYLIQSGHVAIGIHQPHRGLTQLQTAGPGDAVGWSWLVPPHRWRFECRALDDVRGLAFDAEWLRDQCEQDHELGYHLLKELVAMLSARLASLRLQVAESDGAPGER